MRAVVSSPQSCHVNLSNGLHKTGFPKVSDTRDRKIEVDYTDQSEDGNGWGASERLANTVQSEYLSIELMWLDTLPSILLTSSHLILITIHGPLSSFEIDETQAHKS